MSAKQIIVKHLGRREYEPVWREMQAFTGARTAETTDELWFVEHPPVYTLGVGGKTDHILNAASIPVVRCNRGGQVTYHGPGQIVMYVLLDIRRHKLSVRDLVTHLEQTVIGLLADYQVDAAARRDAPGVYVNGDKVAALGLRVSRGCSYHGLALNVDMDLKPFRGINPCGYEGLGITQLRDLGITAGMADLRRALAAGLASRLQCRLSGVV
jgi:lipoyl(octanoyl) transferase